MRIALAFALVGVAGLPLYAGLLPDWILPSDVQEALEGHALEGLADKIAKREFTPRLRLDVLDVHVDRTTTGAFDERIRAAPGRSYWHVSVLAVNEGGLVMGVHTHHFKIEDESNATHRAQAGLKHGIFVMRLDEGASASGVLVFELADDARPARLHWEGEMGSANATLPARG